jgi:hypothetical protein
MRYIRYHVGIQCNLAQLAVSCFVLSPNGNILKISKIKSEEKTWLKLEIATRRWSRSGVILSCRCCSGEVPFGAKGCSARTIRGCREVSEDV